LKFFFFNRCFLFRGVEREEKANQTPPTDRLHPWSSRGQLFFGLPFSAPAPGSPYLT
jgi:hypothetical protein